ncbi:DinB family protein [uncultured Dokdonia sp.]|uniref:DinB family protein n=1 Tax=uncultured Dokdonia sp. TaxID=575653 RepID=UPI00260CC5D3|nr:DinB family protein [uncultured Dokdonia sp.]
MESSWVTDFKENTLYRIDESTRMVEIAFAKAASYTQPNPFEDIFWKRPNNASNSMENQILHLCGNMTQYVISSLGEQEDTRDRDTEFQIAGSYTKEVLLEKLKTTVAAVKETIINATEEQLLKKRDVQGFHFSGMGCVIHAVEHYSYHTGQIAFWVKQLINSPLGFYDGLDLTIKNDE